MAKKIITKIKLQIRGGQANPTPPIGPALGQHGLNISDFCQKFNAATQGQMGEVIPAEITVYADKTFSFILKTAPAGELIKKFAKIEKGSGSPLLKKVGSLTDEQLTEIAKIKMSDLNTTDIEAAKRIIAGSARQMGVEIKN
ncbi:MAG TPA: 50S ribosomal protein L11 [bacterium]|nr:50S ribosomal protein L11 [bacterium]